MKAKELALEIAGAFAPTAVDVADALAHVAADKAVASLGSSQRAAVASLVADIGFKAWDTSRLKETLQQGDVAAAVHEFPRWIVRDGKVNAEMAVRRAAEKALFESKH